MNIDDVMNSITFKTLNGKERRLHKTLLDQMRDSLRRQLIDLAMSGEEVTELEIKELAAIFREKFRAAIVEPDVAIGVQYYSEITAHLTQTTLSAARHVGARTTAINNTVNRIITSGIPTTATTILTLRKNVSYRKNIEFAVNHLNPKISRFVESQDNNHGLPFMIVKILPDSVEHIAMRDGDEKLKTVIVERGPEHEPKGNVFRMKFDRTKLMKYKTNLDDIAQALARSFEVVVGISNMHKCHLYLWGSTNVKNFGTYFMLHHASFLDCDVHYSDVAVKHAKSYPKKRPKYHAYSEYTVVETAIHTIVKDCRKVGENRWHINLDIATMQYKQISYADIRDFLQMFSDGENRITGIESIKESHGIITGMSVSYDGTDLGEDINRFSLRLQDERIQDTTVPQSDAYIKSKKYSIIFYGPPLGIYYFAYHKDVNKESLYCNDPMVMQMIYGIECAHMTQMISWRSAIAGSKTSAQTSSLICTYLSGCGELQSIKGSMRYGPIDGAAQASAPQRFAAGALENNGNGVKVDQLSLDASVVFGATPNFYATRVETKTDPAIALQLLNDARDFQPVTIAITEGARAVGRYGLDDNSHEDSDKNLYKEIRGPIF